MKIWNEANLSFYIELSKGCQDGTILGYVNEGFIITPKNWSGNTSDIITIDFAYVGYFTNVSDVLNEMIRKDFHCEIPRKPKIILVSI